MAFRPLGMLVPQSIMERPRTMTGWLVGLICVWAVAGCGKGKPKPPPPEATATPHLPCEAGESQDPPHREARPAIEALRTKDSDTAVRLFTELLDHYPESSSLHVWRGDARLGQGDPSAALADYEQARTLDARGCKLRERERYFLAVGSADAEIRQGQLDAALATLNAAAREWPDAPELHYQRARLECLQGERDLCFTDLEAALRSARGGRTPRFSRGHRASDHLAERAEQQAEFGELRKEPRYRALRASLTAVEAEGGAP